MEDKAEIIDVTMNVGNCNVYSTKIIIDDHGSAFFSGVVIEAFEDYARSSEIIITPSDDAAEDPIKKEAQALLA